MSISRGVDKEEVVHIFNGLLLSHEKEGTWVITASDEGFHSVRCFLPFSPFPVCLFVFTLVCSFCVPVSQSSCLLYPCDDPEDMVSKIYFCFLRWYLQEQALF